jgi:hypothetical protein
MLFQGRLMVTIPGFPGAMDAMGHLQTSSGGSVFDPRRSRGGLCVVLDRIGTDLPVEALPRINAKFFVSSGSIDSQRLL